MDITFTCKTCGQNIAIDESGAGRVVNCPKCGISIEVPHGSKSLDEPDKFSPSKPQPPARIYESDAPRATSPLPRILLGVVFIVVIVGIGFFGFNLWKSQQAAKAKAEAAFEVENAKRDFSVDVFIRTKSGDNIKCGLVDVRVFAEHDIMSPETKEIRPDLAAAMAKRVEAINAYEAAKGKLAQAEFDAEFAESSMETYERLHDLDEARKQLAKHTSATIRVFNAKLDISNTDKKRVAANSAYNDVIAKLQPIEVVKTDADGRGTGEVPKSGRYVFAAYFSRTVGTESEYTYWLVEVGLEDRTPKKIMLSNDNAQ
jgi:predicted RNA-binding Zn-ribbon protein involved in translation (DUF1610 family)